MKKGHLKRIRNRWMDLISSVTRCWIKSNPKLFLSNQKVDPIVFKLKVMFYKIAQKVTTHLGYFCKKNFVP